MAEYALQKLTRLQEEHLDKLVDKFHKVNDAKDSGDRLRTQAALEEFSHAAGELVAVRTHLKNFLETAGSDTEGGRYG